MNREHAAAGTEIDSRPALRARTTISSTADTYPGSERRVATAGEPRVRTAIGVIMTRFPRIDDTSILREINELEKNGQPVVVVPLLRADARIVHEEAKPWVSRALFTPLMNRRIFTANVKSFFSQPKRYLSALLRLAAGTALRPPTLIRSLALFPKAVYLSQILPERGIRHVHAHFATHATTMAWVISSLSDITYSFTVHGPDVFVHRTFLREKIRRAKFVRAISVFNKAFLSGLYPEETEGKVEVVRSGVNPDVYADAASEAVQSKARPLILSISSLTPSRGFPYLVDACSRLIRSGVDLECRIVGEGSLREATEQWIAEHGLTDRVRLLGALPQHEVARLVGASDIFVLPSIVATDGQMDGIPLPLMEAMAAGKPVIASSISGIPELVRHDVSGILVDSAYAERVAQAIQHLLRDPALRMRMGRAGQEKVRKDFDIRKNIHGLIALLDRVAGEKTADVEAADRVTGLNWSRLRVNAVGVRRMHDVGGVHITEVTIADGTRKREVVVRQPRLDSDDDVSPADRARNEFEIVSMLRQSMEPQDETLVTINYSVPRLLMFDEPNAAIVLERADGRSLAGLIQSCRNRGRLARLIVPMRRTGAWLRLMQSHTRLAGDGRYLLTGVVLLAMRDLDLACAADRAICRYRTAIAERLRSLEAILAERGIEATGQHGDFRAENVFVGERRMDVTGFGRFRDGLALEDVARFFIDLELRFAVPVLHRHVEKLKASFLDGYAQPVDPDALQLFTITGALAMLAHDGIDSARQRRLLRKLIIRSI